MTLSPDATILQKCAAISIAATADDATLMLDLAQHIGFSPVVELGRVAEVGDQLAFYMVHNGMADPAKLRLLKTMRAQSEPRRRYAPIICVVPRGPRHQVVPLVEMGFDEVLFFNDSLELMQSKLAAQLNRRLTYVQTQSYLGPDRRRIETVKRDDPRRKYGGSNFRRFHVLRSPEHGIAVQEQP
ncbi:MAG: hypothetical protein GX970_08690 [Phyllobacteriaceae bacterium]|nr:hypothetical protein [Phyllobacteriaceae bacterium]